MPDDRDLDELLDSALASYADAEPDPSLRARVMARAAEAPARRTWRIAWLAATACAAAILLAFLLYPAHRAAQNRAVQGRAVQDRAIEDRAVNAPATPIAPPQPPAASARLDRTLTHSTPPHVVAAPGHRYYRTEPAPPRRSIALAPAPLTEEEAILLRFAQQHPEQARQVLSPPPSGLLHTDPVIIAPIQIADLSGSRPDAH
jgi:hypothetical protein